MKKKYIFVILIVIIVSLLCLIKFRQKEEYKVEEPSIKPNKVEVIEEPIKEEGPKKEETKEESKKQETKKQETKKQETKNTSVGTKIPAKASITDKKITFDSSFPASEKDTIEDLLRDFFERYYDILAKLKYSDISDMFSNQEYAYIYKTALELLIENRVRSDFDLSVSNVKYELKVKKYKVNNGIISFEVLENCSYRFALTKEYTTAVYNISNNFELVKEDGKYKIKYYKKVQDFYVMITDLYKSQENYKSALDKIKSDYLAKFETQNNKIKTMRTNYLSGNYTTKKCDHKYDRESAYDYALIWVGRRNTSNWHTYSANCVNFVSQVMYAGGIPMDHSGSYQWKWYSTKKNTKNTASGFVYSWTYVPEIVNYFKNNTGYGLCGKYDENLYNLSKVSFAFMNVQKSFTFIPADFI